MGYAIPVPYVLTNITSLRLKKSNEMQQYADIYLLVNYSTCFGRPSHPSSGVHKNVVAASGTGHTIWGASFFKRDQIRTGLGPSQYAGIYLLLNNSTCFGRPSHPSSGVHKTVVAASGTGHTIWRASFFKRDQIRTGLGPSDGPKPEACSPDSMTCTRG